MNIFLFQHNSYRHKIDLSWHRFWILWVEIIFLDKLFHIGIKVRTGRFYCGKLRKHLAFSITYNKNGNSLIMDRIDLTSRLRKYLHTIFKSIHIYFQSLSLFLFITSSSSLYHPLPQQNLHFIISFSFSSCVFLWNLFRIHFIST